MTASETGREIPAAELVDRLRFRAGRYRAVIGGDIFYGRAEATADEAAADLIEAQAARIASLEAERARTRREAMWEAAESAKAWRVVPDDFIVPGAMTAEDLVVARRTAKGIEDHLRELASEKGGQADG